MTTALARKFAVDVTADTSLSAGWIRLLGINDFAPNVNPNLEDASDYDTDGWASSEVTMQDWSADVTVFRRKTAGAYDPAQELIRARVGKFDDAARIGVRWYDKTGGPEANQGVALVTWKRSNTAVKNLEQATITFTGTDVPLQLDIPNPFQTTSAPVLTAVSPSGAGEGQPVAISGASFTGATDVTIGGTEVETFDVINDSLIVAVLPAGAAGSANVVVTTAAGTSPQFAYIRA